MPHIEIKGDQKLAPMEQVLGLYVVENEAGVYSQLQEMKRITYNLILVSRSRRIKVCADV